MLLFPGSFSQPCIAEQRQRAEVPFTHQFVNRSLEALMSCLGSQSQCIPSGDLF